METIVPYKEEFKKYIPEQYKNSEKLLALVNSCMAQFDDLETAFFEILQSLNLADAIGPALDYLGAIVGVKRNPGESDTQYRERIVSGLNLLNLPGPEALRMVIKFLTGVDSVGLFPNWPAEMYYVLDGGSDANLSNLEKSSMTSGASLVRGTFLCAEEGEGGYIVNDDNGMPFVVDYIEIAEIPINVFRFTFSEPDYDPTVAGVGPHGTWTKVVTSNKNEWDWHGTPEHYEFDYAFTVNTEDESLTNWVVVRCRGYTEEIDCYEMFYGCSAITSATLNGMSGVVNAYAMFWYCRNLKTLTFNGAVNNKNLSYFADSCTNLETVIIDTVGSLDSDDTTYAHTLYYSFAYCYNLRKVIISDLSSVHKFKYTFYLCYKLDDVYLDILNTVEMNTTFRGCKELKNVVLKNTHNVQEFSYTFDGCESLEKAPEIDCSSAVRFLGCFRNCTKLVDVPAYEMPNCTIIQQAFENCTSLEYLPAFKFGVLESLHLTFNNCTALKDIPRWDYSNSRNFYSSFRNCTALKDIPEWLDVSSAYNSVDFMFYGCVNIERGAVELYNKLVEISPEYYQDCFKDCGVNTIGGIGDLTKIPTNWGGLGAIPANTLLFNFGDPNYNPNETTTSNHGTWTSYSTGYADNTFNIWTWTYGGGELGWANEFMPDISHSYLSDFENNPVDVVAHGDLTDIKCYINLFCRASALRYCCDFVIPDASVGSYSLQGMFSRCDNLEVFPHIDVTNLKGGIFFIADECTKLTTIKPPTIRSIVGDDIDVRNAFKNCPNVERGAAETYEVLKNITHFSVTTDCFTNCGVNKLTGISDLFKIPTSWGGLGTVSGKTIVFAFSDENYNPSIAGVGAGGTWTELSDNPTDFNIWKWTKSGNDWSGELENAFVDEGNKPYILAIGATSGVENVDNFLKGSTYVRHGALDMYRQMSGQTTPPSAHKKTFHDCGKLTDQGLFELLQIPVNWGGDVLTFCIENNLVAYLPDENQTEVLVQSIRYYQDVFRMMKNSDL